MMIAEAGIAKIVPERSHELCTQYEIVFHICKKQYYVYGKFHFYLTTKSYP